MSDINEKALTIRQETKATARETVHDKLKLRGLTYKQRQFCMLYPATGSPYRAAAEAGYHANETVPSRRDAKLRSTVSSLMRQPKIRHNIDLINRELVKYGVASAVRIRLFWSGIMEDESQDIKIRLQASKLLARCYPEFSEKVDIREERREIKVVIADHRPTSEAEAREIDRLKQAVAVQAEAELAAMNKTERKLLPRSVTLADVL